MPRPTSTSYSVLGLLALRSWTAYELVGQMQRSMRFFWPRSEAHVYSEAKRLVELGWADSAEERTGRRLRTRYSITSAGRDALAQWLETEPAIPVVEIEAMLRLFFADSGTAHQVVRSLTALRDHAQALDDHGRELMTGILEDGGPFPERLHLYLPLAEFYHQLLQLLVAWSTRTIDEVGSWDSPAGRPPTAAELERLRELGEDRGAM